jgi:hypothetical protein
MSDSSRRPKTDVETLLESLGTRKKFIVFSPEQQAAAVGSTFVIKRQADLAQAVGKRDLLLKDLEKLVKRKR